MTPNIRYRILWFEAKPWWVPRYQVNMDVQGFELAMVPDAYCLVKCWTLWGARRYVKRIANRYDYKVLDDATMVKDS